LDYRGEGVILGIVDIGFQTNNPTFYSTDGKRNRIKRFWAQSDPNGIPPLGYNYGSLKSDSASIENLIDDHGTHGTHVAGIAGGSGYTTPNLQYQGVAPDADLVFVSLKYYNDTLGGSALGDWSPP
jgi:subtilisin family serine protease